MITFEKIRSHPIPTLQATLEEYREPVSGALHVHLATQETELAFLVGFPTVPDVSDGRAHILEHLALCGSQRYPVRDPFFSMLRRSTATFMNAMTYADRTAYPFASTDRNDFFNLLDVYLDAAFFPRLDYLNFRQEGWRHTLADGKLGYQGVVFNEMKGAFTDPIYALYKGVTSVLLKDTTYEVVSGGDPLAIPDLSHQMLKDFHASHYHPSQAVFMTAGAIDAADIQQRIAERVLAHLPGTAPRRVPELAVPAAAPQQNTVRIPSQTARDDEYGLQLTWLLGESADPAVYYHASLLSAGLLGDASAPLKKAMESAGYGRPSRLNGEDPSARQMLFHVGMEGLTQEQVEQARTRLWRALEQAAVDGVPLSTLQAALRDLKYSQRDTASGRMPNALGRMLHALPVAMRGGDVLGAFDSDPALRQLEQDIADPAFFKGLVRALLDSPARLDTTVVPDAAFFTERAAVEEARLAATLAAMDDAERARIAADTDALDALQRLPSDSHVLPRIKPGDVSAHPRVLPVLAPDSGRHGYAIASNGISYARVQFDVSALPAEQWPWLQLYAALRRDLGVAEHDYEQAGAWRQRMVPAFALSLDALTDGDGALQVGMTFGANGLSEDQDGIAAVLSAYIGSPRFDEHERIAFLIERMVQNRLNGLAQSGNRYAALAASAPLSPLRRFEDTVDGVAALPFLGDLQRQARTPDGVARIAARLLEIHARVLACPASVLCASVDAAEAQALADAIALPTPAPAPAAVRAGDNAAGATPANAALYATSQVNHCSIAWPAPRLHEADAAALAVAAELLTHQVLHQALREQGGAYGGSASYAANAGVFTMGSYRDPRLAATYADFGAAIERVLDTAFTHEQIEEAVICVIKALDKPDAPFDAVLTAWGQRQRGITPALRQQFRSGVLACTEADVKAAVRRWLHGAPASRAAFAGNTTQELAGLDVVDLLALSEPRAA